MLSRRIMLASALAPHRGLARARADRNPMVARDDRRQQRRRREARRGVQREPEGLQGRPELQGLVSRHDECRHRRLPGRQRAAHHAGLRGRHRDHDVRQGRGEAGARAHEGGGREVRPAGLSFGDHRLLLDLEGRDAVLPIQLVLDGDVVQQGRLQESRPQSRPAAEDLARGVRGCEEAEGRRPRDLRLLECLGDLGRTSSSSRPGTTCRSGPRPTGSTASIRS